MKPRILLITATILALGGGMYWFAKNMEKTSQPTVAEHGASIPGESSSGMSGDKSVDRASPSSPSSVVDPKQFCDNKPACNSDPHIPNNANELRWMQQHGYPTKDEIDRMARLSEVELEQEAKRGNLVAMTELGSRMINRNDPKGSLWFIRAADSGSIYAYYGQSQKEMNRTLGHGLVESGAYLRLAYLLGDYKAATALYEFTTKEGLDIVELNAIDRRAASLYITYAKNRQPAPRPFE